MVVWIVEVLLLVSWSLHGLLQSLWSWHWELTWKMIIRVNSVLMLLSLAISLLI